MRVLFCCEHNTGRSQMAEAFFNRGARERGIDASAESAGCHAAGIMNPFVVVAMEEVGICMDEHRPKSLTLEMAERAEWIVAMGEDVQFETCPIEVTVNERWDLADPAGKPVDVIRKIAAECRSRVEAMLLTLPSKKASLR